MSIRVAPCGSWSSVISADMVAAAATGFGQLALDGPDLCWSENRPAERGRVAVVRLRDGVARDLIEAPFSARTRAHEYGGGAFTCADGVLWFANDADQRVYRCDPAAVPRPLTAPANARYADFVFDRTRHRLICVREDHAVPGNEPRNELVSIDEAGGVQVLAGGADFYSSPCLSPDGKHCAWLSWSHPDMPWDATELWVAEIRPDGPLGRAQRVAGGSRESATGASLHRGPRLGPIGESANGASLHRGPRLDFRTKSRAMPHGCGGYGLGPIGESANGASLHRGPRLSPIGESANGASLHRGPRLDPIGESVFQPQFAPDGTLYFVSDRSGWWNLWCVTAAGVQPVAPQAAEFGLPQWTFGMSTYAFTGAQRIVAAVCRSGRWRLVQIDTDTGRCDDIALPYTEITGVRAAGDSVYFIGAAPAVAPAVVRWHPAQAQPEVLRRSSGVSPEAGSLAEPQPIEFATGDSAVAHGFYYAPRNALYRAPPGEKPPLLVVAHGGPTAASGTGLNLRLQYWTSRGFAVLDVNYRGSTGYGRAYREALNGAWGVADVDDCVAGARHLVGRGLVDGSRLAIRGGSAGGYTALCALAFRDVFRAGASLYGVSDLEALARDTHKFEARYLDRLIGPWPAKRERYRERSPVHFPQRLSCPVIFFQGLDDKVVPPDQTARMADALRARGIAVACLEFAGEAHGFRQAENIRRVLEAELYFYGRVFGFTPADPVEPVAIDNLG
jgi:dipeptidyl aminopeptidase/acylaminoacyl peptidase